MSRIFVYTVIVSDGGGRGEIPEDMKGTLEMKRKVLLITGGILIMAIGLFAALGKRYTIGTDPAMDKITSLSIGGGGMSIDSSWSYTASRSSDGSYSLHRVWWDDDENALQDRTVEIDRYAFEKILESVKGLRYVKYRPDTGVMDGESESSRIYWDRSPGGSYRIEFTDESRRELMYALKEAWDANSYRANGPADLSGMNYFSFGSGPDDYIDGRESFDAELDEESGKVKLSYKPSGTSEENAYTAQADAGFMELIAEVMRKNGADTWDGFRGNDSWVMDGSSFSLFVTTADGTEISASGRMNWPDGFHSFRDGISELFLQYFPDAERR